jgi:hypothetical protein
MEHKMRLFISKGKVRSIYDDLLIPLIAKGADVSLSRASHVEPHYNGTWYADMAPMKGPVLKGFKTRSAALKAERDWLNQHHCKQKGIIK